MRSYYSICSFCLRFVFLCLKLTGDVCSQQIKPHSARNVEFSQEFNQETVYPPDWDALDKRPIPSWYDAAKVGIFVVWGVWNVPSVYSESFWYNWKELKDQKYIDFMKKNFKPGFTYADFAPQLTGEFLDTDKWADLFKSAGAQYVVFNAKWCDGYANYPSNYAFNWNSKAVGANRDIVGELTNSLKIYGIRVGLLHSLMEWFHPLYLKDKENNFTTDYFITEKILPEQYELVNKYKPDIFWSDGDWEATSDYLKSKEFLAWLYSESPVKDDVVTNDRWGTDARCKHGGFFTCEDRFNPKTLQKRKWENAMTIDKLSWGFRRNADLNEFLTTEELIATLVETISCGGNILINVAPSYDGSIPLLYQERLSQLGSWLDLNYEAIYGSFPWKFQNDTVTANVWYTGQQFKSTKVVYAIALDRPEANYLYLGAPVVSSEGAKVWLLGAANQLEYSLPAQGGINITIPRIAFSKMPCHSAWVFRIIGLSNS